MTEKLLQYIWQFGFYNHNHLTTTTGEPVQVLFAGNLNTHQGPDFSDARIRIGNTLFAGQVELHVKTSDWQRHRHSSDENYRNVILHVVYQNDEQESALPLVELQPLVSSVLLHRYESWMSSPSFIPCAASLGMVKEITWVAWKERLLVERLSRKAEAVLALFEESNHHWEETFWWLLARNFGLKVNAEAFEAVARSIPVNLLARHKNQIHQLEALLLGQAGLLQDDFKEEYPKLLQREYRFLQHKYNLRPVAVPVHFLRMRPVNFPTVRLAQLAAFILNAAHLFSTIIETETVTELKSLFSVTANDYWHYHYRFDEVSEFRMKRLGGDMISNLVINTVVPVVFAYGRYFKKQPLQYKALRWLEETAAESNAITRGFVQLNIANKTAYDSQALIELKNQYCAARRCLYCSVGNAILKNGAI